LKTSNHVAIKLIKKTFLTVQKVKNNKQIQAAKILSPHENIINLIEILYDDSTGNFLYKVRKGRVGIRTHGAKLVRIHKDKKRYVDAKSQILHVPITEINCLHAQQRNFPQKHKARKHPDLRRLD
jgi:hypothetical protein